MSTILSQEPHIFRTIGPVVYVNEPHEVEAVFKNAPQTGAVIVQTSLPDNFQHNLQKINHFAQHHPMHSDFNLACKKTRLYGWLEEQLQELGSAYPTINLYRTHDIRKVPWHIDPMQGRLRAFVQLNGVGLKFANPTSVMRLEFNLQNDRNLYVPNGEDPDQYLQDQGISIVTMRQGHMAVFGDYGLHASGEGEKLRAIAH